MKAVRYSEPYQFGVTELADPSPADDQVLVRVTRAGVCGTDLHLHAGEFDPVYPLTPGHEMLGDVVALGPAAHGVVVGQQVAIDNASPCGHCPECGRGQPLFCHNFASLGVNGPGGFAEQVLTPAAKVFAADDLDADVAVFAEPLACAVHGMDVLQLAPGSDVVLLGAGTTGLLLAQLLLHGGAARLTVAAPTQFKLDLASSFGADRVVQIPRGDAEGTARTLRSLSPDGYDVAIDATGAVGLVQQLPGLVRDGGTVMVYGMCEESDTVSWSPYEIFRRQLTVKGSFAQVNCFDRSLTYLRSGRVQTDGMITHRFGLDDYGAALEALRSDPTCLKVVVQP